MKILTTRNEKLGLRNDKPFLLEQKVKGRGSERERLPNVHKKTLPNDLNS